MKSWTIVQQGQKNQDYAASKSKIGSDEDEEDDDVKG